jgi:hypothetical protein
MTGPANSIGQVAGGPALGWVGNAVSIRAALLGPALLVRAAHAGARTKGTYLQAQYRRLAARRGKSRAAVAVGHTILVVAYHLLRDGTDDHDLGSRYFDGRDRRAVERRLVHQLEDLGYKVSLEPAA